MALWTLTTPEVTIECESPSPIAANYADVQALIAQVYVWKSRLPATTLISFEQSAQDPELYKFQIDQPGRVWKQDYFLVPGEVEIEFLPPITGRWKFSEINLVAPLRDRLVVLAKAPTFCTRIEVAWT